jgi:hypothetical protein
MKVVTNVISRHKQRDCHRQHIIPSFRHLLKSRLSHCPGISDDSLPKNMNYSKLIYKMFLEKSNMTDRDIVSRNFGVPFYFIA